MKLRPYQEDALTAVAQALEQGHRRVMLALATGAGKTVIASEMIRRTVRGARRAVFIVDRIVLCEQAARHLAACGLSVGILQGENTRFRPTNDVIVASVQTLRSRGLPFPDIGLIVIDEAHLLHKAHIQLMQANADVPTVGLSATPLRPDLGRYFSHMVRGPSVADLTDSKHLVPAVAYCPGADALESTLSKVHARGGDYREEELAQAMSTKQLVGDIVNEWQRHAADRPTLAFACTIPHSKLIVEDFHAVGVDAEHVDAYTPTEERREIYDAFAAGEVRVLSSVNVCSVGFDLPEASCAVLARPTLSEAMHMQQLGRVIRPALGKGDALVLDHSGNTVRFGLPVDFSVPDLGHEDRPTEKPDRRQRKRTTCTACHAVIPPDALVCEHCGADRPIRLETQVSYRDGQLVPLGSEQRGAIEHSRREMQERYAALLWYANHRGHSAGWAFYAFQEKFGLDRTPWRRRENPPPSQPTDEQERWIRQYVRQRAREWRKRQGAA